MKKFIHYSIFACGLFLFTTNIQAQSNEKQIEDKPNREKVENKRQAPERDAVSEAEKNLEKAAESIQRSAEKIKIVVEDRADKIAKTSQPAIESFLIASSNLIEKIALELEKMLSEKPVKK